MPACNSTAIPADQRARHGQMLQALLTEKVQEIARLPTGYTFRFAADAYDLVASFVANERRCCPFYRFIIEVTPDAGPIWLRIEGPPETLKILSTAMQSMPGTPGDEVA